MTCIWFFFLLRYELSTNALVRTKIFFSSRERVLKMLISICPETVLMSINLARSKKWVQLLEHMNKINSTNEWFVDNLIVMLFLLENYFCIMVSLLYTVFSCIVFNSSFSNKVILTMDAFKMFRKSLIILTFFFLWHIILCIDSFFYNKDLNHWFYFQSKKNMLTEHLMLRKTVFDFQI